jgi:hypothetical protein
MRKSNPVHLDIDDVEETDDYNSDDDPEWRNTPMAKRIRKLKEEDDAVPPKMPDLKKIGKRLSRSHCSCTVGGCRYTNQSINYSKYFYFKLSLVLIQLKKKLVKK